MGFPQHIKEEALIACQRHCVLCHRQCGIEIEVHHIIQEADGGGNDYDNAIPLCSNCHAIAASYNPHHPRGNKFSVNELKRRRNDFYQNISRNLVAYNECQKHDYEIFRKLMLTLPRNGSIWQITQVDFTTANIVSSMAINDFLDFEDYNHGEPWFYFLDFNTQNELLQFCYLFEEFYTMAFKCFFPSAGDNFIIVKKPEFDAERLNMLVSNTQPSHN